MVILYVQELNDKTHFSIMCHFKVFCLSVNESSDSIVDEPCNGND